MSELALQLIQENKKNKSPRLDLGNCGITKVPEAIGELIWLEELILSEGWYEYDFEKSQRFYNNSQNKGSANKIENLPPTLPFLTLMKKLIFNFSKISDLSPISGLTNLQQLICYSTQISDLSPISKLTKLQHLNCGSTKISDLGAISGLTNLQQLGFGSRQISDLSPISGLTSLKHLDCSYTQINDLSPISGWTNLQHLKCGSTQINDLSPISGWTNLQHLDCSHTKINDLSPISGWANLQHLDCSHTKINDLSPISGWTNLQHLNCGSTQINDLSSISGWTSLKHFDCCATQINDLSPISGWTELQHLNCGATQINDLSPISGWTVLQHLDCFEMNINDLSPISGWTDLQGLICCNTRINDLSPISGWTNLQQLDCSYTQINDLSPISGWTNLQQLDCTNTRISDLSPISGFTNLQHLSCSHTKINDLSPILPLIKSGRQVKWEGYSGNILVEDCPLVHPPVEIVKQGNEAILRYFEQIETQLGTAKLFEAKIIIVGEGETGKTTLFEKLKDENHDPIQNPSGETHGINIKEGLPIYHPSLGENPLAANLWDFGGQDLQYMTHQFFLTPRALYVLLMDARKESPNLAYWFKIISLLGKESENSKEKVPLLLVFNKRPGGTGKTPLWQDVLKYYEDHLAPDYIEANLAQNAGHFHLVRSRLEEMAAALPIIQSEVPKQWKPIREALRTEAEKAPYITAERLAEICLPFGVTDWRDQFQMTDYLHKLGSLLHFQNDEKLTSTIILRPSWAVEGVYTFLKDERLTKQNGHFSSEAFFDILCEKGYTKAGGQKILQLMTKDNFDICYEAFKGRYVAAQLLPDNAPTYTFHKNDCLQFRYQYPIMPKGLMSRLIVRLSEYLETDAESCEQIVWKKGAVLRIPHNGQECRVRIMEDDAESTEGLRQIIIEVLGEPNFRKYGLQRVRQEVNELHRLWFRSIHADEMVPCCCEQHCKKSLKPHLHKLEKLVNLKFNRRKMTAECGESGEDIRIDLMLEGVYEREEIKKFERETVGERYLGGVGYV